MTNQDPLDPQPQRRLNVNPLWPTPTGTNPPRYQNQIVDRGGPWNSGTITVAVVALLAVVGVILWASNSSDQQTASNPPTQTTGQSSK